MKVETGGEPVHVMRMRSPLRRRAAELPAFALAIALRYGGAVDWRRSLSRTKFKV